MAGNPELVALLCAHDIELGVSCICRVQGVKQDVAFHTDRDDRCQHTRNKPTSTVWLRQALDLAGDETTILPTIAGYLVNSGLILADALRMGIHTLFVDMADLAGSVLGILVRALCYVCLLGGGGNMSLRLLLPGVFHDSPTPSLIETLLDWHLAAIRALSIATSKDLLHYLTDMVMDHEWGGRLEPPGEVGFPCGTYS